jgi:hypothetical protein
MRTHGGVRLEGEHVPAERRQLDRQVSGACAEIERPCAATELRERGDLRDRGVGLVGTRNEGIRERRVVPRQAPWEPLIEVVWHCQTSSMAVAGFARSKLSQRAMHSSGSDHAPGARVGTLRGSLVSSAPGV